MPSLWEKLTNVRYTKAVETYSRKGGEVALNRSRSGALAATAVAARAAAHAEGMPESPEVPPPPPPSPAMQALRAVASGVETVIGWEQKLTAPFGMIPFPAFPALRVLDFDVGLPHAHNHPPNITPPNPVPVPLPSTGPIIKIPILSGASTTMINMMPAARCGDMGLGVWCGGFFPFFEVFLGSSTVWIEGARAGRLAVDITKHCTFTVPKPSDPPMGPMIGTTVGVGSANVMIGGIPLPSLFSLACAQMFKALFKVAGAVLRRVTAKSYVQKLLKTNAISIAGGGKYADDVVADLRKMAQSPTGRSILKRIQKSGKNVQIQPYIGKGHNASAGPTSWDGIIDATTGLRGPGSDVVVKHTPGIWTNHAPHGTPPPPKGTSSDSILNHEMNHAANATEGKMSGANAPGDTGPITSSEGGWDKRWKNFEEYNTTHADNAYRRENGLPQRTDYGPLP